MVERPSEINAKGENIFDSGDASAASRLKQEHISLTQEPEKRGRGRPKGSKSAPKQGAPVVDATGTPAPDLQRESFNRQMGMVHRAMGNIMAITANCTAWLLDEKQEKDLGEALGNVLYDLGFATSLTVKIMALAAVESSVWGFKYMQYRAYLYATHEASQTKSQHKTSPDPDPYTSTPGLV